MEYNGLPEKQGLYDPQFEHDACGIGFIANIKGKTSHGIINQAIQILKTLHTEAVSAVSLIQVTVPVF